MAFNPFGVFQTLFDAMGHVQASNARQDAYVRNVARLELAAQQEAANAVLTMQAGGIEAGKVRMKGSSIIAQQRVAFGASGVDGTMGTAADLATSSRLMSELDAQTTLNNAARQALGHKLTAASYQQKIGDLAQDKQAQDTAEVMSGIGDFFKDAGSILGGK